MSTKTIKQLLKSVYPKGKVSVWYCCKPKCGFLSQSIDDAVTHEVFSTGKHVTKVFTRH